MFVPFQIMILKSKVFSSVDQHRIETNRKEEREREEKGKLNVNKKALNGGKKWCEDKCGAVIRQLCNRSRPNIQKNH